MANYSLTFARTARKELEKLPRDPSERILNRIETLQENPRPNGAIKLQGEKNLWRIRIGDYRVIYSINDEIKTIDVSIVRHRRDAYRGL